MTTARHHPLIVVIDDDASVRKSLCRLIRSFGYRVEAFDSAPAFLGANHSVPPDCLVLDVHMPGVGGFELHEQLREAGNETAVIYITAHADEGTREKALCRGAIDLLAKPFSDEDLKANLKRGVQHTAAHQS